MNPNPLILLASARKESDTKKFLEIVFKDTDHALIDLLDFYIAPFNYDHTYPREDNFFKIIEQIILHDVIVLATPVYWYAMSGIMKTFFDRLTDLITIEKKSGRQLKGKSIFLIAVGAEEELPPGFEIPFKATADYLDMEYQTSLYYSIKHSKTGKEFEDSIQSFSNKIKNCSVKQENVNSRSV